MFIMLYDLEGELDSVKFTYQAFAVVEVLDEAGVSRASTISFLYKLLKSSFVTLSGMRPRRRTQYFVGH
jgi:hypothetical protein